MFNNTTYSSLSVRILKIMSKEIFVLMQKKLTSLILRWVIFSLRAIQYSNHAYTKQPEVNIKSIFINFWRHSAKWTNIYVQCTALHDSVVEVSLYLFCECLLIQFRLPISIVCPFDDFKLIWFFIDRVPEK